MKMNHFIDFNLEKDIFLNELKYRDLPELFSKLNENVHELSQRFNWMENPSAMNTFIHWLLKEQEANKALLLLIKKHSNLIGAVGFNDLNWSTRESSLKYWLDKRYCGQGIVTKACQTLINHGFKSLKLKNLYIHAALNNPKSLAVAKRLHFIPVKTRNDIVESYGKNYESTEFKLDKARWQGYYK